MTTEQILAGVTFGCGGLLFVVIGLAFFVSTIESHFFRRRSLTADGIITGYEAEEVTESPTKYHPTVKYRDHNDIEHHAKVAGGTGKPFAIGRPVRILYHPHSPQVVWIVGYNPGRHSCLVAVWFVIMGSLAVLMGVAIWVFRIPVNRG